MLALMVAFTSQAQFRSYSNNDISNNVYFGGSGGIGFGTQYFTATLSPLAGYKITDEFSAGMQLTYQYNRSYSYNYNNFGGGPFAMYAFQKKFAVYAQYEYMSIQVSNQGYNDPSRIGKRSIFGGIGWISQNSGKSSFMMLALYDLGYGTGANSPYSQPWQLRFAYLIGY